MKSLSLFFAFLLSYAGLFSQSYHIHGTVTDEIGEPLPAVTVRVRDRSMGGLSDLDGKFSFRDSLPVYWVTVNLFGYISQEIEIRDSFALRIELKEDLSMITDPQDLFPHRPQSEAKLHTPYRQISLSSAPLETAQGSMAGVSIQRFSGAPGASISLRVRGHNHIASSNEPLYVINGIEMSPTASGLLGAAQMTPDFGDPLRFLAEAEIADIRVLKGPETARYGQRGANGVVLIKTLDVGSAYYTQSASIQAISSWPKLMDTEAYETWADQTSLFLFPQLLQGNDTDWLEEISRTALATNHHLLLTGKKPYRLSLGMQGRQGTIRNTSYNRLYIGFFSQLEKSDWKLKIRYNGSLDAGRQMPSRTNGFSHLDLLESAYTLNPTLADTAQINPSFRNPLQIQEEVGFQRRGQYHLLSLQPELDLDDAGQLEANVSMEIRREQAIVNSPFPINPGPIQSNDMRLDNRLMWMSLSYKNSREDWRQKLSWEISWKSQFQWRFIRSGSLAWDAPFGYGNMQIDSANSSPYTYPNLSLRAYHAPVAEVYYEHEKGIKLLGGMRMERLQSAEPSSYRVEEKWRMYPYATLSVNPFSWRNKYARPHSQFRLGVGAPGWGASRSQMYNLAWDFNFEKGGYGGKSNWTGSLEVYRKYTNEARFSLAENGMGNTAWEELSVGRIQNQGIELQLRFRPQFKNWRLGMTTDLNLAYQHNRMISLDDSSFSRLGTIFTPSLPGQTARQLAPGESIGSFVLPAYLGVDASGQVRLSSARWVGQGLPKYIGGFQQSWFSKKFSFSYAFEGAAGFQLLNDMAVGLGREGGLFEGSNFFPEALSKAMPAYYIRPFVSDDVVEQGNYLRLKNIRFSYNHTYSKDADGYNGKSIIFSFTVQNVFIWTRYTGNDPEIALAPLFGAGQDYFTYPLARVWTLGVSLEI